MRLKHWFYTIPLRLRSIFRRRRVEQELDEELRYHLERQIEEHIAKGMTPEGARNAALRAMGGVERRKEECRDTWRVRLIEDLARDVHFGLRAMRKDPGFTAVAALTLALGIGANTAVFSVINAALIRPLPFAEADRLVMIWETQPDVRGPVGTYQDFLDWRVEAQSFQGMSAFSNKRYGRAELTGHSETIEAQGMLISYDLFSLLGL